MRNFTIRRGNYKGTHIIYDSIEEAHAHNIKSIKEPWHDKDVTVGDWVVSDDGYVVKCLARRKMINKRHRHGQYTDTFRFPQGTFYVYYDKSGEPHIKNFYASVTNSNKSSMGNTSKLGKFMTIAKREFVLLMSMGYDPYSSYIKAFKKNTSTPAHIMVQVNKLLTDPLIREALMEAMKPFMEQVQSKVKELSGVDDLNKLAVEDIAELLVSKPKQMKDKIAKTKFFLDMFGHQLGIIAPDKKTRKEIQDAEYEEVPPQFLGERTQSHGD